MALIPKICDPPEEPNSKRSKPYGNNASTGISRGATEPATDSRADKRQAARTALRSYHHEQRPYQTPERRPRGCPRPADNTPAVRSQRSAHQDALHAPIAGQAG
jgi:hypothetical protein